MYINLLIIYALWNIASAVPTTKMPEQSITTVNITEMGPKSTVPPLEQADFTTETYMQQNETTDSTSNSTDQSNNNNVDKEAGPAKHSNNETSSNTSQLLHHRHFSNQPNSRLLLRGRVILASTRHTNSSDWGTTQDEAEIACENIAVSESGKLHASLQKNLRLQPTSGNGAQSLGVQGHLLSVSYSSQVTILANLLNPVPEGAYWTGGRLLRYATRSPSNSTLIYHTLLTWTDGRVGSPNVLGMTRDDSERLEEGVVYCLALDFTSRTWQARDCDDRLAYACLIAPRHSTFTNQLNLVNKFKQQLTTESVDETTVSHNEILTTSSTDRYDIHPTTEVNLESKPVLNESSMLTGTTEGTTLSPVHMPGSPVAAVEDEDDTGDLNGDEGDSELTTDDIDDNERITQQIPDTESSQGSEMEETIELRNISIPSTTTDEQVQTRSLNETGTDNQINNTTTTNIYQTQEFPTTIIPDDNFTFTTIVFTTINTTTPTTTNTTMGLTSTHSTTESVTTTTIAASETTATTTPEPSDN